MNDPTAVVVEQLPEQFKLGQIETFLRKITPLFQTNRPRVVFDFSRVKQMDSAGVDMLLYCMEEAMKRNGDLKLAAVPPQAAIILELTRIDRLFEIFENTSDAVESFLGCPTTPEYFSWPTSPNDSGGNDLPSQTQPGYGR